MTHEDAVKLAEEARELSQSIQFITDAHAFELKKAQMEHKRITTAISDESLYDSERLTIVKSQILDYHISVDGSHETIPYVSFRGAGKLVCVGVDMESFLKECQEQPELQRFITINTKEVDGVLDSLGMAHGLPESVFIDKAKETVVIAKK
jgi:hypothetical protein